MEDMKQSLSDLLANGQMQLPRFFPLAIQLSGSVAELHQLQEVPIGFIPDKIYWDSEQQHLTLEQVEKLHHEGSVSPSEALHYIAPEQTGLINQEIDHRANLYTLGTIFYKCLTGVSVFEEQEDQLLIQSHLTVQPVSPVERNKQIPSVLSDVVMKLLEKNPEDRYQSALGLQIDLQECQDQFVKSGHITSFELGRLDYIDTLQISNRLYGRDIETKTILQSFEQMNSQGVSLLMVAGYSGVGKTSLIETLIPGVEKVGGTYVSGKYDQFTSNIPFDAIIQAFQSLIRKTLSKTDAYVAEVKVRLLDALGENGRVIVDLVPELELLIGTQPVVPELAPEATKNRFHFVFQNFVSAFTSEEQPLVVFIDDLQWVDQASLDLLFDLVCKSNLKNILIVGAYRDNEVDDSHALITTLKAIEEAEIGVEELTLPPIGQSDLDELIADTLSLSITDTQALSQMIYAKTQGNPFFVKTLIRVLYESQVLNFDIEGQRWVWDLPAIVQLDVAENVAEFLGQSIQSLPRSIQQTLQYGACIGNTFNLHIVAEAQEKNIRETALELETAVRMNLISPVSESAYQDASERSWPVQYTTYRFLHDRVQEASDRLISEDQRKMNHLRIGQTMLANAKQATTLDDQIIDIVQHLNQGSDHMIIPAERIELAQLNLTASKKAKVSTAFEQAYKFGQIGIDLLPERCWELYYQLTLALYEETAEFGYLNGEYQKAEENIKMVLKYSGSLFDTIRVHEIKIQILVAELDLDGSIKYGLDVLNSLDEVITEYPDEDEIIALEKAIFDLIKSQSNSEILNLPILKSVEQTAVFRIIDAIITSAYQRNNQLRRFLNARLVYLSLSSGNSVYSIAGYALS